MTYLGSGLDVAFTTVVAADTASSLAIGAAAGGAGAGIAEEMTAGEFESAQGGTALYRGLNETHHAYDTALDGQAWPGDVLGHSDGVLHAAGFTEGSAMTSWTTDRAVAESFARARTGRGVILHTTLEEQAHRVVPGPDALGESEILLRGVVFNARVENLGW